MPLWLWLVIGGGAAYLVAKSASAAASSASQAGAPTLSVTAANGHTFQVPMDPGLPPAIAQEIQTFFGTAGQSSSSVQGLSTQLATQGYTVAAGSVQMLWAMIQASSGTLAAQGSGIGGLGHGIGSLGGPTTQPASTSTPYATAPAPIQLAVQPVIQPPTALQPKV